MESPAATSSGTPSVQPAQEHPTQAHSSPPTTHCGTAPIRHVLVTGFPPWAYAEDLLQAFVSVEGPAPTVHFLREDAACLHYTQPHHAATAVMLHDKTAVCGEPVSVRELLADTSCQHLVNKRHFPRTKHKDECMVRPEQLDLSGEWIRQMDGLVAAVRLTEHEAAALHTLYGDVQAALRPHFPGCVAIPFGSTTTGLATKASDADCYVQLPPDQRHLVHNMVHRVHRILHQQPEVFAELMPIPRANTPIIKFHHLPTGTNCDLSFKSPLGHRNSLLLAHLLRADPRLVPLAVVLKYWAKVHQLTGIGRLSNYAFTMCVVFYLQRAGLVPSVRALQVDPRHEHMVDGWNTGYDPAPLVPPPPPAAASPLSDLVGGFFEFYEMFDWERYVVCPYLGACVERDTFTDVERAGAEFELYARNVRSQRAMPLRLTAMCVQDPFELCHNAASRVSSRHLQRLRAHVKHAAAAYRRHRADDCRLLLRDILLRAPPPAPAPRPRRPNDPFLWPIALPVPPPDDPRAVHRALLHSFRRLLLMPLARLSSPGGGGDEAGVRRVWYSGVVTAPVWKRRQFEKLYERVRMEFGSRQRRVTEEILCVNKVALHVPYRLCVEYVNERQVRAVVEGEADGDPEVFRQFGSFLSSVLPRWIIQRLEQPGGDSDTSGEDDATDICTINEHGLKLQ